MSETGVIYAVICAVAQGVSMAAMGFCLEHLLTGRDDKISKRTRLAIFIIFGFLIMGMKCLFPMPALMATVVTPAALSLFYILFLKCCYDNKSMIKLVHIAMLIIQNILADIIQALFFGRSNVAMWENPFYYREMAEACMMVAAISIMLNIGYTALVLRIQKKERVKTSPVWIAMMLFIMLIFTVMRAIRSMQVSDAFQDWYFIFLCAFITLLFATLMLFLSQSEKREAQAEVQKLQQVMELEKLHYEQIEARREEMAKLRHDYNNVITSVMHLIETGKTDEAGNVIEDLAERISRTKEYPYCGVPIINAVLTEKQNVCEEEAISLSVDLLIPDTVSAADLDLCMIFGNLMDNAIRSSREVREEKKECSIILNAGVVQNYLIIKCRNTSLENREKKIKGTGYGHKILADIAGKYDGDFQTAYEAGIFTAQISLRQQRGKQHE